MIKFTKSGIPGLDKILGGGFVEGSIVTVSGPTGAGKSTFGVQFLYNGATQSNEPGLYISIEETRQDFVFHMSGYNWDVPKLEKDRKFLLLDYPIHEVDQVVNANSAVQEIIQTTGAKRVVIDSVMPIALHFSSDDERKRGFIKLIESIRKWGTTTLVLAEDFNPKDEKAFPSTPYGIESFTDGWVNLSYKYDEKSMERKRYLEVIKMKGAEHMSRSHQYTIDKNGITIVDNTGAAVTPVSPMPKSSEKKTKGAIVTSTTTSQSTRKKTLGIGLFKK